MPTVKELQALESSLPEPCQCEAPEDAQFCEGREFRCSDCGDTWVARGRYWYRLDLKCRDCGAVYCSEWLGLSGVHWPEDTLCGGCAKKRPPVLH